MKINLKNYLLYSSVFSIFTEAFFINFIIDWKLFYFIIFFNYFLILKYYKTIKINIYFKYIILFFIIHGVFTYSIIGIPPNFMISQILGISIVGIYFYNFVKLYKTEEILNVYLKLSLAVAIIAYPLYFFNINLNDGRLQSIFKEPAHYVIVVIPACYYLFKKREYFMFLMIFGTLILSNSSLGYIGCALIFILPNFTLKRFKYLFFTLPFILVAFGYIYKNYEFMQIRVDDTINNIKVLNTGKFKDDTNLSSYLIIANSFIMKKNVIEHPLGSGIGSHHYMHHNKYIYQVRPPEYLVTLKRHKDNSFDANSLGIRMISEFGVFGIIALFYFLYLGYFVFSNPQLLFCQGLYLYFLLKVFRDGHYFPPEFYFFIWFFYFFIKKNKSLE